MNQFDRGRAIRWSAKLTHGEKVILWELSDTQGERAFAFTKQDTMAARLKMDVRNLRRTLADLDSRGWLTRGYMPNPDPRKRPLRTYAVVIPQDEEGSGYPVEGSGDQGSGYPVEGSGDQGSGYPVEGSGDPIEEGSHDPAKEGSHDPTVTDQGTAHGNVVVGDPAPTTTRPTALDPAEYHQAHPVVVAIQRAWRAAYAQHSGGREYVPRGHGDTGAAQRLAHWCVRHCDANGGVPEEVAARIVEHFLGARWVKGKPPAMSWLDIDHHSYPLDPAAYLEAKGPGPAKVPPELATLMREASEITKRLEHELNPAERQRLEAERRSNIAERKRLKQRIQETTA